MSTFITAKTLGKTGGGKRQDIHKSAGGSSWVKFVCVHLCVGAYYTCFQAKTLGKTGEGKMQDMQSAVGE